MPEPIGEAGRRDGGGLRLLHEAVVRQAGVRPAEGGARGLVGRAGLEEALQRGYARLKEGKKGACIDAVEAAIRVLEDSPLFNAGKGAVFTHEGRNELDAAIMEGKDKKAGAVAGVTIVKNPITAARAVMERSPHVLLVGRGAELFAIKQKLEVVHPEYFCTEQRWNELPELEGTNLVARARPGATVLGVHPTRKGADGKPLPVLTVGEAGKGRVLTFTSDSSLGKTPRVLSRFRRVEFNDSMALVV